MGRESGAAEKRHPIFFRLGKTGLLLDLLGSVTKSLAVCGGKWQF